MALYLDHHQGGLNSEMAEMVRAKVNGGEVDQFGAKAVNVIWSDSETWCLSDAPSPDAVHKAHEAIGVTLGAGDIQQIQTAV